MQVTVDQTEGVDTTLAVAADKDVLLIGRRYGTANLCDVDVLAIGQAVGGADDKWFVEEKSVTILR